MKVLFAVSEAAPVVKLGGLGDVGGSLPKALQKIGVDVDVVIPYFSVARTEGLKVYKSIDILVPYDNATHLVEVYNTKLPDSDVDLILLRSSEMFSEGGKNAFLDIVSETEMFSFFDRAVVEYIKSRFNTYDLIHCNDWHTGLITHLLADELEAARPATLFTIHNLLYQGVAGLELINDVGLIPGDHEIVDWDIRDGDVNLMLQGIASSDYVNSVSPSYAREIMTAEFGGGMDEILRDRSGRIVGILNGLDYGQFPRNYDVSTYGEEKGKIKKKLQKKLGLEISDAPLFSFISRLDPNQKGLDILYKALPEIIGSGGQFVLLGTGDKGWEEKFRGLEKEFAKKADTKGKLSVSIKFDVDLAKLIYSGSDFLVVPSKYEPCGLIQMIAMWYGTLPVVHAVGGLKDSVDDGVTGFTFDDYNYKDLVKAAKKAIEVYGDKDKLSVMVKNAMREDFSWERSAQQYKDLYARIIKLRRLAVELSQED